MQVFLKTLAVVCTVSIVLLEAGFAQANSTEAGTVSSVIPNAYLIRNGSAISAKYESAVRWGDTLRTDGNGRATIRLQDGSVISLGEYSEVRIQHDAAATSLILPRGIMRADSLSGFTEIQTPSLVIHANRGEMLIDAAQLGDTAVICVTGSAEVTSGSQGSPVLCRDGDSLLARNGESLRYVTTDDRQIAILRNASDPNAPPPFVPFP
jgi:ferric-dicitrate binding protein FerR (iron transport regulator)